MGVKVCQRSTTPGEQLAGRQLLTVQLAARALHQTVVLLLQLGCPPLPLLLLLLHILLGVAHNQLPPQVHTGCCSSLCGQLP